MRKNLRNNCLASAHVTQVADGAPQARGPWLFAGSGLIQRRCLDRGVFCSLEDLTTALREWIKNWNDSARPFKWTKTPTRSSTRSAATATGSHDQLTSVIRLRYATLIRMLLLCRFLSHR